MTSPAHRRVRSRPFRDATGPVPHGPVPHGPVPTGSVPTGSVPTGSVPTGSVPTGSVPTGSVPPSLVPTVERGPRIQQWRALGTYVHLAIADNGEPARGDTDAEALGVARAILAAVDHGCSRFRADSELRRLNARSGDWVTVSDVLAGATAVALEAAESTCGLVDPTLEPAMVAAGYDRTFEMVAARGHGAPSEIPFAGVGARAGAGAGRRGHLAHFTDDAATIVRGAGDELWRAIEVDGNRVRLPKGVRLDLGATGKAYAADLVAAGVSDAIGAPVLVSLGGDVAVAAPTGQGYAWPVAIAQTPEDWAAGTRDALIWLERGGIATSTTLARRWHHAGRWWHHIIDPRTGMPAADEVRTATAIGRSAVAANAASTAAIVLGAQAPGWLAARRVGARLVRADGAVDCTPDWPRPTSDVERNSLSSNQFEGAPS